MKKMPTVFATLLEAQVYFEFITKIFLHCRSKAHKFVFDVHQFVLTYCAYRGGESIRVGRQT